MTYSLKLIVNKIRSLFCQCYQVLLGLELGEVSEVTVSVLATVVNPFLTLALLILKSPWVEYVECQCYRWVN